MEQAHEKICRALGSTEPVGIERITIEHTVGRVLAHDVTAKVDSPPFDRSEVDGYAVRSKSTYGAEEDKPVTLKIIGESAVGKIPKIEVELGEAVSIATGAPIPRNSNAVVMIEYSKKTEDSVTIYRSVVPGENVAQTGSDVMVGDLTLKRGTIISPREVGVLTATGHFEVAVYRKPSIAIFSTGNELVPVTSKLEPGKIFDVNGPTIKSMIEEMGAKADYLGILPDNYESLRSRIDEAISQYDMILTSGSTSAGLGDMIYRVFQNIGEPGVLVHGLRIRPGKPTVAAVAKGKALIGLPGFPVSAMIAFTALVKPLILQLQGLKQTDSGPEVTGKIAFRIETGRGARYYIPVNLVESQDGYAAYPLFGGSGAISTLSLADGYVQVPEKKEFVDEGEEVQVRLLSRNLKLAELNIIGSNCPGIDLIIELSGRPITKQVNVGSTAGWKAVEKGEADIAGTHLLDEETMTYNIKFMQKYDLHGRAILVRGYSRRHGLIVSKGNPKHIEDFKDLLRKNVLFINRNKGSGTRAFIDQNLGKLDNDPENNVRGYTYEARTHSAVAAAVSQGRADAGIAIEIFADAYNLDFIPLGEEIFDFLIPKQKIDKPSVQEFLRVLRSASFAEKLPLRLRGYNTLPETGKVVAQ